MRMFLSLIFLLVLTACHTNFRQPKTNELGYLPVGNDAEVLVTVNHGVDTNQFRKTLYVSTEMHGIIDQYAYEDYIMEAFRQLDFFDTVLTRQPTVYINARPPAPTKVYDDGTKWIDVLDPVTYPDIVKQYGRNVMVAKAILRNKSDDFGDLRAYYFQLQLIDPSTSRVLFQASKSGVNTLGIDNNVINPVLNYAKGYLQFYDPTFVLDRNPSRNFLEDEVPVSPFSYRKGM